jgi:hypothetical protein
VVDFLIHSQTKTLLTTLKLATTLNTNDIANYITELLPL